MMTPKEQITKIQNKANECILGLYKNRKDKKKTLPNLTEKKGEYYYREQQQLRIQIEHNFDVKCKTFLDYACEIFKDIKDGE